MATVTNTIKLPGNITPAHAAVEIELVASSTAAAAGWVNATDVTIVAKYRPTVTAGAWTADLTPNADIDPSGTVYRITEYADKTRVVNYIEVGSGGGSVHDLLVDAPGSLATAGSEAFTTAAVAAHAALTAGAHAASAITVADAGGNFSAATVETVLAELFDGKVPASNPDAAQQFTLGPRSAVTSLPAASFRPQSADTVMAVDVMPNGSPSESADGFAWIDVCSTDILDGTPPTTTARVGISSLYAVFGSRAYGGATTPHIKIEAGAGNPNHVVVDPNGVLQTINGSIHTNFIRNAAGQPFVDFRQSGTVRIASNSATDNPLSIKGATGQTGDMLKVMDSSGSSHIRIAAAGTSTFAELILGHAARPTNATTGFLHIGACAGTPTGTPANLVTGTVPLIADTSGSKLWAYIGGTWKSVTFA